MGGSLGMGRGLFSRESWFHFLHNKKLCLEQKKTHCLEHGMQVSVENYRNTQSKDFIARSIVSML